LEFLELLLVVLGVGVLLYGRLNSSARKAKRPKKAGPRRSKSPIKPPVTVTSVDTHGNDSPPAFDPETSISVPTAPPIEGPAYVVDGDTIRIAKTQIRLYGIDAPELNHPYGKKAKWELVRLCKGQAIRAEITDQDAHGRTVAKCFLPDGRDLSEEMVKAGLAIDWPKFSGGIYLAHEVPGVRKKLWLAAARQKGHMGVWKKFEADKIKANSKS